MTNFVAYADQLKSLLESIVDNPESHARWLNTLSYMENCGAKLIARCEHPTLVPQEMLKHAAEEFRHAYTLKQQIHKLMPDGFPSYATSYLLAGYHSLNYMKRLSVGISRILKQHNLFDQRTAYTLTSFTIELRAQELYPLYQEILRQHSSRVTVKAIIADEEEHLEEMTAAVKQLPNHQHLCEQACVWEGRLCSGWLKELVAVESETQSRKDAKKEASPNA